MKQIKFLACLSFIIAFSSSCFYGGEGYDYLRIASSELDVEGGSDYRSNRRRSSRGSSKNKCLNYQDCEEVCEDVYDTDRDSDDGRISSCMDLKYSVAIKFEEIWESLRDAEESALDLIETNSFYDFMSVSVAPWVDLTDNIEEEDAKALLIWTAKNSEASKAIVDAYKNYEVEFALFEGLDNLFDETSCDENLSSGRTFEDIACDQENNYGLAIYETLCGGPISCRGTHNYSKPNDFPLDLFYRDSRSLLQYVANVERVSYVCILDDTTDSHERRTQAELIQNTVFGGPGCQSAGSVRDMQDCHTQHPNCVDIYGPERGYMIGSGVFIDRNRILTNQHVVDTSYSISLLKDIPNGSILKPYEGKHIVEFAHPTSVVNTYEGNVSNAETICMDPDSDVAIVYLDDPIGESGITFGNLSDLSSRDRLIAMGQPGGRDWIISQGYLRSKNGDITCRECLSYEFPDIVPPHASHDQPGVAGGNSGGPIFDESGRLVGLIATGRRINGFSDGRGMGPHVEKLKEMRDRSDCQSLGPQ